MQIYKKKKEVYKSIKRKKSLKSFYIQLTLKGIGFKLFTYSNFIAFDLGTSNILLLKNKNDDILLKVVKNDLYLFSKDLCKLNNFSASVISLIKRNKYKGKGIFNKKENFKLKAVKVN